MDPVMRQLYVERLENLVRQFGWKVTKIEQIDSNLAVELTIPRNEKSTEDLENETRRIVSISRSLGWELAGTGFTSTGASVRIAYVLPEGTFESEEIAT